MTNRLKDNSRHTIPGSDAPLPQHDRGTRPEGSEVSIEQHARMLWQREGGACVSGLVYTLAQGYGLEFPDPHHASPVMDLMNLAEQAWELSAPIDDWEEAAIQAGFNFAPYDNPVAGHEGYWWRDCQENEANDERDDGSLYWTADSAMQACGGWDIDPYQREVFEHWTVSDWLADKLEARGEKVDRDFAGLTVWARTTTGQAVYADSVIEAIARELHGADL